MGSEDQSSKMVITEMVSVGVIERPVALPPLILERFDDFKKYASQASVVAYAPEYIKSPFLDDQKRVRRVTLYAVGVIIDGLPHTFKYVLEYSSTGTGNDLDALIAKFISDLECEVNLVRGTVDLDQVSTGEILSMSP
jgi:hypothetical protein